MRCPKCSEEFAGTGPICNRCVTAAAEVKVLRPDERDDFQGLTIQQTDESANRGVYQNETNGGNYEYRSEGPEHRVYVRQVSLGSKPWGFLTKLLIAVLVLFFVFVALPVALLLMVVFSVLWWLFR